MDVPRIWRYMVMCTSLNSLPQKSQNTDLALLSRAFAREIEPRYVFPER